MNRSLNEIILDVNAGFDFIKREQKHFNAIVDNIYPKITKKSKKMQQEVQTELFDYLHYIENEAKTFLFYEEHLQLLDKSNNFESLNEIKGLINKIKETRMIIDIMNNKLKQIINKG